MVKNQPEMWETWVWSLGQEDPLETGMETHSSILAWRVPWTEEPGGLYSMGLQRVRHDWATNTQTQFAFSLPHCKGYLGNVVFRLPASGVQEGGLGGTAGWKWPSPTLVSFISMSEICWTHQHDCLLTNTDWAKGPYHHPPSFLHGDGRIVDSELRFGKWKQEQSWIIE